MIHLWAATYSVPLARDQFARQFCRVFCLGGSLVLFLVTTMACAAEERQNGSNSVNLTQQQIMTLYPEKLRAFLGDNMLFTIETADISLFFKTRSLTGNFDGQEINLAARIESIRPMVNSEIAELRSNMIRDEYFNFDFIRNCIFEPDVGMLFRNNEKFVQIFFSQACQQIMFRSENTVKVLGFEPIAERVSTFLTRLGR